MEKMSFEAALESILEADDRYDEEAYLFIREALDYTIRKLSKPVDGPARHVSGGELLEGIRDFALVEFGPITKTVLNKWGLQETEDFGNIVFNLVERGVLGKTEEDRLEDFYDMYSFEEAFRAPFIPEPSEPESNPKQSAQSDRTHCES